MSRVFPFHLRVIQRVIRRQIFPSGSSHEMIVAGNKGRRRHLSRLQYLAGHQRAGKLNGIVSAQTVVLSQFNRTLNNRSVHREKQKRILAFLKEKTQRAIPLLERNAV